MDFENGGVMMSSPSDNVVRLPTAQARKVNNPTGAARKARKATPWPLMADYWQRDDARRERDRNPFPTLTRTPELAMIHAILAALPIDQLAEVKANLSRLHSLNPDPATGDASRFVVAMYQSRTKDRTGTPEA